MGWKQDFGFALNIYRNFENKNYINKVNAQVCGFLLSIEPTTELAPTAQ